jgi:hypothetical protein
MLAVPLHQIGERAFIDNADIGGDVIERLVATQLFARRRPSRLVGQSLLRVVALECQRRTRVAP